MSTGPGTPPRPTGRRAEHVVQVLSRVSPSPLLRLRVRWGGRTRRLLIKDESRHGAGSVKDRTAVGLLRRMHQESPLQPGTVVVESTSGNLGVALGRLTAELGLRLVAVVDPTLPTGLRQTMAGVGVELVDVDERGVAGYLPSRIAEVMRLCAEHPHYRWPNQYTNPANWRIHREVTGPELAAQVGPELGSVYVAVSTGGTLAGISRHLRTLPDPVRIVAVDAQGSVATGGEPGPRLVSGIGAGQRSVFLSRDSYDVAVRVSDAEAIASCRLLFRDTGLAVGGSSGSVLHAYLVDQEHAPRPGVPLCLSADSGRAYLDSYYDDAWLAAHGLLDEVCHHIDYLRWNRLAFTLE